MPIQTIVVKLYDFPIRKIVVHVADPVSQGSYLTENTARVDSSGNDSTGTVGDSSKPFLTVQGALTALENSGITFSRPFPAVVLLPVVGIFDDEDLTTSLRYLAIVGPMLTRSNPDIGKLTLTADGVDQLNLTLRNIRVSEIVANDLDPTANLFLILDDTILGGDLITSASLSVHSLFNSGASSGTIVPGAGKKLVIRGLRADVNSDDGANAPTVNAPASNVFLIDSYIDTMTAAGNIFMQDSVISVNNSGQIPTYADLFMNPVFTDFSTLPIAEPTEVGKAWIDTTGGLNIVKVKL